jgi:hypothetical protein
MTKRSIKILPKVFISYRRDDTGGDAGRLNDMLNQLLGPAERFLITTRLRPGWISRSSSSARSAQATCCSP